MMYCPGLRFFGIVDVQVVRVSLAAQLPFSSFPAWSILNQTAL